MSHSFIATTLSEQVLEIRLCRPERKNALNLSMYEHLANELTAAAENSAIRVAILTGSDGCFTSGNDLQDFIEGFDDSSSESPMARFLWAFTTFPKPIIVAIDGPAIGIGTTLLLHCDLAYASPTSEFKLPFASLGLCPEYASSFLLPRLVGYAKASEWLLLGQSISAEEAAAAGLINAVVDAPLNYARDQAKALAKMPPTALRRTKALLKAPLLPRVQKVIFTEADAFVKLLQGPEFAEAVTAFFEKRPADFSKF